MPTVVPDLTVEVLSKGNTHAEIETKLDEYFTAGVTTAWIIDPAAILRESTPPGKTSLKSEKTAL